MGRHAHRGRRLTRRSVRDEDDLRLRPVGGSRPRSRLRPQHADATAAVVVSVDRGRYGCVLDGAPVTAVRARELGRRSVVVGDAVDLVGDLSGQPGGLARIVRIRPRSSTLRRSADDTDPVERVLVANAEQLVVVVSAADPPPRPRLVDRCLVAAHDGGLTALLAVTKADLADPEPLLAGYRPARVPAVVLGRPDRRSGLPRLRARLAGRTSVLVGHSGVGKSTLVNRLVPDAGRRTAAVGAGGRGRHTSASAVALPLPGGGWIVDTPGVRSFGLAHVPAGRLLAGFPELAAGTADCPTDCEHLAPDVCALDEWVTTGHAHPSRLDSLRRLLRSRDADAAEPDPPPAPAAVPGTG